MQRPNNFNDTVLITTLPSGEDKKYKFIEHCGLGMVRNIETLTTMLIDRFCNFMGIMKRRLYESDLKIDKFMIGKTYCDNSDKEKGIASRWGQKYKGLHYDFLIAFAILTDDNIQVGIPQSFNNTEQLVIGLEQSLINYCVYKPNYSKKLANASFSTGRPSNKPHDGKVLYLAVKLK